MLGYRPPASATGFPHIYVNPPLAAWLLRPIAALPLTTGLAVFSICSLAALLAGARLLERLLPRYLPQRERAILIVAATASLPAAMTLVLAQWDAFLLLAGALALWALQRDRPAAAGALLSVLLVKPQAVWLLVPLLLAASRWRIVAGFLLGAAVWAGSALLLVGPRHLAELPDLVRAGQAGESKFTAGLPALVWAAGGARTTLVASVLLAIAACVLAWHWRRQLRSASAPVVVSLGICASILCAPHVFSDDLLLLAVPLVVLAATRPRAALSAALALSVAFALDEWVANLGPRWAEAAVVLAIGVCLLEVAGISGSGARFPRNARRSEAQAPPLRPTPAGAPPPR